jgi:hypothetical protein
MLTQVGSVTTNGLQQQTLYRDSTFTSFADMPVWPSLLTPTPLPPGEFPLFSGVRMFAKDYRNPRIYSANVAYEQELAPGWSAYVDFTWAKGVYLSQFLDYNDDSRGAPYLLQIDEMIVATSRAKGLYRGGTLGVRKRFSNGYQLEANYVLAKDLDTDSNERDPFTDRTIIEYGNQIDLPLDQLNQNYGPSDRDIRHKFNFFAYGELPGGLQGNARIQARSAQPFTPTPRIVNGEDLGRNSARKDNAYFSFDWRLQRPFRFGKRYALIPTLEMFNTFNSENNINTVSAPPLFDFSGFLRLGVGDPRQLQFSVKFTF